MKYNLCCISIFFVLVARSADASAGWVCDQSFVTYEDGTPKLSADHDLEKYVLKGNEIETVPDPDPPAPTVPPIFPTKLTEIPEEWDILLNNSTGLVAVQTEADIPALTAKASVWTDVLLIDKINLTMKEFDGSAEDNDQTITSGPCKSF